jgi:L,D-peptidoglycan transpeptidase YkuD (ErfK/YbiS/YcfS/YnhG family)
VRLAAAIALVVACGRSNEPVTTAASSAGSNATGSNASGSGASTNAGNASGSGASTNGARSGSSANAGSGATSAAVIPASATELLVVITDDWKATRATLRRYRRDGSAWKLVGDPWPGVVGYGGTGWGDGLHGRGAPTGRSGPPKREGDGRSPAGVFPLDDLYGYAKAAPAGTRFSYTPALDATWQCIDDPRSHLYNQIVDARSAKRDWSSAEPMRRGDSQYEWAVFIGHNPARTPKHGSCVFLHVWTGEGEPTTGCTAMAEPIMRELIATLDPAAVFVLLPKAEYAALGPTWGLPSLE